MLLEATGSGANLWLDKIPKPQHTDWVKWLQIFPSYGFLLTADSKECEDIIELFASQDIDCAVIGEVTNSGKVQIQQQNEQQIFWDFQQQAFTGLNYQKVLAQAPFSHLSLHVQQQEPTLCQV